MPDQLDKLNERITDVPPGAPNWVTVELIQQTLKVWQPFYSQTLIPEDALEIIMGADRMFNCISRGLRHDAEEIRSTGSRQQP